LESFGVSELIDEIVINRGNGENDIENIQESVVGQKTV
jgi:hypothetical protein